MHHLTPDALVDLAEGARAESSAPHLQTCEACRRQLACLRGVMTVAAAVEVPEPSPLFWDHLSARVGDAVANAGAPAHASWLPSWFRDRRTIPLLLGASAAVALAVAITLGSAHSPAGPEAATSAIEAAATPARQPGLTFPDDPSLDLVADLATGYDWESASEAGLTTSIERTDTAIGELSPAECQELERLLKQEMARPGA